LSAKISVVVLRERRAGFRGVLVLFGKQMEDRYEVQDFMRCHGGKAVGALRVGVRYSALADGNRVALRSAVSPPCVLPRTRQPGRQKSDQAGRGAGRGNGRAGGCPPLPQGGRTASPPRLLVGHGSLGRRRKHEVEN